MNAEQAKEIAERVLAGFGYQPIEAPRKAVDSWQVFYRANDGEIVSAFMDDGPDPNWSAERLGVAIRSAISG
jgi:hypothetical protein